MSEPQENQTSMKIAEALSLMAEVLGLRKSFLTDLLFERDDWSFVVKAHALLESIVCTLLAAHLNKPELEDVLAEEVEMNARIEMLKALKLVNENERAMMRALGRLRNTLVHNAKQTDFAFLEYLKDRNRRDNFSETFGVEWPDPVPSTPAPTSRRDYVLQNPKLAIWASLMGIAVHTVSKRAEQVFEARRNAMIEGLRKAMEKPGRG